MEYISIDKGYLSSLKLDRKFYNPEIPLYELNYKLEKDNYNIQKIKEMYPYLNIGGNVILDLEGAGDGELTPHNKRRIKFYLDENKSQYLSENVVFYTSEELAE